MGSNENNKVINFYSDCLTPIQIYGRACFCRVSQVMWLSCQLHLKFVIKLFCWAQSITIYKQSVCHTKLSTAHWLRTFMYLCCVLIQHKPPFWCIQVLINVLQDMIWRSIKQFVTCDIIPGNEKIRWIIFYSNCITLINILLNRAEFFERSVKLWPNNVVVMMG